MVPVVRRHLLGGMRSVFEQVVLTVGLAGANRVDFAADRDHRLAKTVQLIFRFALRRLDHYRAGHRERDGRRVEAVIHQTLGHVFDFDASAFAGPQIEDAFVSDQAVLTFEQDRKMSVQPLRDVIGVQDRNFRCLG